MLRQEGGRSVSKVKEDFSTERKEPTLLLFSMLLFIIRRPGSAFRSHTTIYNIISS